MGSGPFFGVKGGDGVFCAMGNAMWEALPSAFSSVGCTEKGECRSGWNFHAKNERDVRTSLRLSLKCLF